MKPPTLEALVLAGVRALAPLATLLVSATPALAAPGEGAIGEALFREAQELLKQGKVHEACQKFAASQRADPAVGTLLNLAACYEREGRTATAWSTFSDVLSQATSPAEAARASFARTHMDALAPKLHRLAINVPAPPAGLEVRLDGIVLESGAWGSAVPVDPGAHEIAASAPGRKPWSASVTVAAGPGADNVVVPALEPVTHDVVAPTASTVSVTAPPSATSSGQDVTPHANDGSTQRIAGLVIGGAGIVAVGLGTFFGLQANSRLSDSNANGHCLANDSCDATGLSLRSQAEGSALASTLAFVIGGAAIAGGVVLFLTAPKGASSPGVAIAPMVGLRDAGLVLRAGF